MATIAGGGTGMLSLENELTCFICTDILYQPLTLIDCLHTFCGSCLKSWFQLQHHKARSHHSSSSSSSNPYTCPTCRGVVKDARPNAMVNTWLDMFLVANPSRAPSQEEKDEKQATYKSGDNILPKVVRGRRRERRGRREEDDRLEERLVAEARERSLRDAQISQVPPATVPAHSQPHPQSPPQTHPQPQPQPHLQPPTAVQNPSSRSRERDREREERRTRRREAERQRRHRVQAAESEAADSQPEPHDEEQEDIATILPPATSPRHPDAVEARQRQQRVMHQASLVSLISSSEGSAGTGTGDSLEHARIMQEILATGILDGIDVDTLTDAEQDMWAERIAEAVRERTRARQQNGPSEPPASVSVDRGNTSPRQHLATSQQSRERSGSSQRAQTMPSTRSEETLPERIRTTRTDPVESPSTLMPPSVVVTSRRRRHSNQSQTNASSRNRSRQSSPSGAASRPESRSAAEFNSNSQPVELSAAERVIRPPIAPGSNTEPRSPPVASESQPSANAVETTRPPMPELPAPSPPVQSPLPVSSPRGSLPELPGSGPRSPRSSSRTLSQTTIPTLAHFDEPCITCFRCYRSDIQYEAYKHCERCDVDLCYQCYRRGRGCRHWFGFGHRAMARFEAVNADKSRNEQLELPHVLIGRLYRKPHDSLILKSKMAKDGRTIIALRTMSDPALRLQEGLFCDRCRAFAGSTAGNCFWFCSYCNSGEWGFCKDCVNSHHCCTHALLPIARISAQFQPGKSITNGSTLNSPSLTPSELSAATLAPSPASAISAMSATVGPLPGYTNLYITTHCDICGQLIQPSYLRYHCPFHQSPGSNNSKTTGDYDVCTQCYHNLVKTNRIKRDDGPAGWRKCPLGHRMIITNFGIDEDGLEKRHVSNDLVGGRMFTQEDVHEWTQRLIQQRDSGSPATPTSPSTTSFFTSTLNVTDTTGRAKGRWLWRDESSSDNRQARARNFCMVTPIAPETPQTTSTALDTPSQLLAANKFPPEGGFGGKGIATYSYLPDEGNGGQGELSFPRGAEIRECYEMNESWWEGWYAGDWGIFPAGFIRW